jgi:hypothetical protein
MEGVNGCFSAFTEARDESAGLIPMTKKIRVTKCQIARSSALSEG